MGGRGKADATFAKVSSALDGFPAQLCVAPSRGKGKGEGRRAKSELLIVEGIEGTP